MARAVNRQARRTEIAAAAATVFAERGVGNTTVDDIARAAGVAKGTFYLHFRSKDDVVVAVAERFGDAMVEGVERAVAARDGPAVGKIQALRDALSDSAAIPGASELMEILHRRGNRAIHDRLDEHLAPRLVSIVESIIKQGVAEGAFAVSDVHAAAWFVLGGLQSAELSGVALDEMSAALATATELALRALGYKGARP